MACVLFFKISHVFISLQFTTLYFRDPSPNFNRISAVDDDSCISYVAVPRCDDQGVCVGAMFVHRVPRIRECVHSHIVIVNHDVTASS